MTTIFEAIQSDMKLQVPDGVVVTGELSPEATQILTPDALALVAKVHREFNTRRVELLKRRAQRQAELDAGKLPDFLSETEEIRASNWTVAPIPADLQDRRVEITGPTDRKMIINALNSGAKVFMADCRGCQCADVVKHGGRPGQLTRCNPAEDRLHKSRG